RAGRVFCQSCISGVHTPRGAIFETEFELSGQHDYVLTAWRRMPVHEGPGRNLAELDMRGRPLLAQNRMRADRLFLYVRLSVRAGVQTKDSHFTLLLLFCRTRVVYWWSAAILGKR